MIHATLRGRRYRLVSKRLPRKVGGYCEPPTRPNKAIAVCSTIRSPEVLLENIVHEVLHGALWDLDEVAIRETGECIARILMRLGVHLDVARVHQILKEGDVERENGVQGS